MSDNVELAFDPRSPAFKNNPYPYYKRLRAEAPVYQHPAGFWCFSRHEHCSAILRDNRWGHNDGNSSQPESVRAPSTMVRGLLESDGRSPLPFMRMNPPDHTRVRALVNKAFGARAIDSFQPLIEERIETLVREAMGKREVDLMLDFATGLPMWVMCNWFAISTTEWQKIRKWVEEFSVGFDPSYTLSEGQRLACHQAAESMRNYLRDLIALRSRHPQDDLVSMLIQAHQAGSILDEGELIVTIAQLLVAGNETSVGLLGNGLLNLIRHPEQFRRLANDRCLINSAIEELLRFDSPLQFAERTALEEIEVDGHTIKPGDMGLILIGSANRDEKLCVDPDLLDVTRQGVRHLSFGVGIHFCIGAQLARVLTRVTLEVILSNTRKIELVTEPKRKSSFWLRSLETLPVRLS